MSILRYLSGSSANANSIYPIEDETRAYSLPYPFGRRCCLVSALRTSNHYPITCWITSSEYISHGVVPPAPFFLITCLLSCEHDKLITFTFPIGSGTSRTRHPRYSARQRTTTISCKGSPHPLFALLRSKRTTLTLGFKRMGYAGRLRVVRSRLVASMWRS